MLSPLAIAGQPIVCGGVGSGKLVENHSRTGGLNWSRVIRQTIERSSPRSDSQRAWRHSLVPAAVGVAPSAAGFEFSGDGVAGWISGSSSACGLPACWDRRNTNNSGCGDATSRYGKCKGPGSGNTVFLELRYAADHLARVRSSMDSCWRRSAHAQTDSYWSRCEQALLVIRRLRFHRDQRGPREQANRQERVDRAAVLHGSRFHRLLGRESRAKHNFLSTCFTTITSAPSPSYRYR